MFKKVNRLSQKEFEEFYKIGKKSHFPHLIIITSPSPTTKTAVGVGKKVSKSAVRRNTLRRRVNAVLYKTLTNSEVGVVIIILKPTFNPLARKAAEEFVQQSIAEVVKSA